MIVSILLYAVLAFCIGLFVFMGMAGVLIVWAALKLAWAIATDSLQTLWGSRCE